MLSIFSSSHKTTMSSISSRMFGHHGATVSSSTMCSNNSAATVPESEQDLASRRPRPVFFWSNGEVMKWLKRCCEEYYELYGDKFLDNEITGRSLIRINEDTLKRMGVENGHHRDEITRIILKLKLKSDMIEIKDLERKIQPLNQQSQPNQRGSVSLGIVGGSNAKSGNKK